MDTTEPVVTIAVPRDLLSAALFCVRQHRGFDSTTYKELAALTYGVPANPELNEAMHGAAADRVVEDFTATLGARTNYRYEPQTRTLQPVLPHAPLAGDCPAALYDKLVAPQGRKQVTIFVPERGIDGKTIRPLVVEKELTQVFGWYLATHGVRGSADSAKTPVIAFTVAVADDLGVRDAVGIAGRAAALTGAPVTVTLDTGDMVKVDAMGQFV